MAIRRSSTEFLPVLLFLSQFLIGSSKVFINGTQVVRDGEPLFSADGTFGLGFFSSDNSKKNRYLGIWFAKLSVQTVVWVANREHPLTDTSGVLKLRNDGNLVILDGKHNVIWSSNVSLPSNKTTVEFLDSGNLELKLQDSDNRALWQSFDHPSDTFLGGMKFGVDLNTGEIDLLRSWMSTNDPSIGGYTLGFDPSGIAQIIIWDSSGGKHWRSGQWNGQILTGVPEMTSFSLYGFNIITDREEGKIYCIYTNNNASVPSRFVVSPTGRLERSYWSDGAHAWDVVWSQPNAECEKYSRCGAFGSCDDNRRPLCSCLTGFEPASPQEWNSGNWSSGCVRRTELDCGKNNKSGGDGFLKLAGMKLPDDSKWVAVEKTEDCEARCRTNCSCVAFAYESGLGCLTWHDGLVDLQKFHRGGQDLYLRLADSELSREKKGRQTSIIVILIAALGATIIVIYVLFMWKWVRRETGAQKKEDIQHHHLLDWITASRSRRHFQEGNELKGSVKGEKSSDLPLFGLDAVRVATNDFSRASKLGEGGFGPVYKGKLPNGQEIAVKRLSKGSGQGLVEFENEVILIAKLQHRNLVRLLGCCMQGEERMLIYEYMPNTSLDCFLFDQRQRELLDWKTRFTIIEGIGRGLLYLHRDSRLRIVHRDLKASNILLDDEMNPKISDFGMARIFGGNQNQANTIRVVGTYGYMAPEYAMEGLFSVKSDVFSFGVLLLEVISSKRNTSFHHPDQPINLLGYAWNLWKEEKTFELIDPTLRSSCSAGEVLRCVHVGLLCVQDNPCDRPTMDSVVLMLSSESAILTTPKQPAFSVGWTPRETDLYPLTSENYTVNELTVSVVEGR